MPPRIGSNSFRKRRTFFKEWREHRDLTQDEALARLGQLGVEFSKPSISRLENGHQPYSEPILCALAEIYQCEPADLISRNPSWGPSLDSLLAQVTPADREKVLAMVQAFARASGLIA